MRGLLRSSPRLVLLLLAAAACSQIIGVSGYEIDPSLDEGTPTAGSRQPDAGAPAVDSGGSSAQPSEAGQPGRGGHGAEPSGCESADECDDGIDCTTDACLPSGTCAHDADDSRCDASKCQTCLLGLGCVAGSTATVSLLTDAHLDGSNEDWVQTSDTFDDQNIFADELAQTAPNLAKFGPAASGATKQEYGDLIQRVDIPERTVAIDLKGYYKLTPGATRAAEDYVAAGFYELGATDPSAQFHEWRGVGGAQAAWKAFRYSVPHSGVAAMVGGEYTFDLVAYSWESVFLFDSLELTAIVCE